MSAVKKIPQRLCLGCQEVHPKKELIRIVRSPEGEYSVDPIGKKPGRGAYICHNEDCFNLAVRAHRFSKAFKENVSAEILEDLKKQLFEGQE